MAFPSINFETVKFSLEPNITSVWFDDNDDDDDDDVLDRLENKKLQLRKNLI